MTTIYCLTNGEIITSYDTQDDYPHLGGMSPPGWKHIARIAHNDDLELAEAEAATVLIFALKSRQIKETKYPVIEDHSAKQIEPDGVKMCIIRGVGWAVACTLAKAE